MKTQKTPEEISADQDARCQDKADRQDKCRAAQLALTEAKIKLKEAEALPVSHNETKAALLAQLDEASNRGKSMLIAKSRDGAITLSDLMQDKPEIRAFIHSLELENAIDAIFPGKGGLSLSEKQGRVSAARRDVQFFENEVKRLA